MADKISGIVNDRREAIVEIQFFTQNGERLPILEMLIDTGFDGSLMIPKDFAEQFQLPVKGQEFYYAANDEEMQLARTTLQIQWLGDRFDIPALIAPNNYALIGTEMLIDTKLFIDYENQTLEIKI